MNTSEGFNRGQIKKLVAKLDRRHVRRRIVDGKSIDYIEGWFAIAQANALFGFDGWDRQTLHMERLFEQNRSQETHCAYTARVRVQVRAGECFVMREGSGFGEASASSRANAHERALKAAETDATKRALATFGNRFGLALYDKDQAGVTGARGSIVSQSSNNLFSLHGYSGEVVAETLSAEAFCGGLRQMITKTQTAPELKSLAEANRTGLDLLRTARKELVSAGGRHFADILLGIFQRRQKEFSEGPSQSHIALISAEKTLLHHDDSAGGEEADRATELQEVGGENPESKAPFERERINKSQLLIPAQRRVRSKAHLLFVRSKPCVICGEFPSHAHHLTFAEPRGLSIKVSDEFTVPLCAMHHNILHQGRNERSFWAQHGIDALALAAQFWTQTSQAGM